MAITFNNIAVEESSTITAKVATVVIARGSTNEMQEILVIGDPQSSLGLARVVAAAPASTEFGLIVRIAGGPSSVADLAVRAVLSSTIADNQVTVTPAAGSTWAVRPLQSSAADLQMTATPAAGSTWNVRPLQSSAADLQMTATPLAGSTWNVRPIQSSQADLRITAYQSTAADFLATVSPAAGSTWSVRPLQSSAADLQATVTPAAGSTWSVRPLQSSQADLRITAYQSTATDFLVTATLGTNLQSTAAPSSNSSGLVVRQVIDVLLTTASSNAFTSSGLVIQSSGAGLRSYVTAYSITTTNAGPTKVAFWDSSGATLLAPIVLGALSSGISGVNLAVGAPAYLFRGASAANMTLQIPSSQAGWKVWVSYFRAP